MHAPLDFSHGDPAAVWRQWFASPDYFAVITERRLVASLALVSHALNSLDEATINYVDVGCARGGMLMHFRDRSGLAKAIHSIGIDPVDTRGESLFTHFVRAAVAKQPEESAAFYVHEDSTCSSLKHMIVENVVHEAERIDGISYFAPREVTRVTNVVHVPVLRLDQIIAEKIPPNKLVHFVKIDAQGVDIGVFESIGTLLDRCLFVQIETIVNEVPGRDSRLYEGQSSFRHDRAIIEAAGFRLLNRGDFVVTPEADALFVNRTLADELLRSKLS